LIVEIRIIVERIVVTVAVGIAPGPVAVGSIGEVTVVERISPVRIEIVAIKPSQPP
jgi:hypothetical protein